MRITNNMMFDTSVRNLNRNLERMNTAQIQYSTQSKIQVPSDDPAIATRAIKYRDYVADVEQYAKNTSDATSWMEVSDDAMQDVSDYIERLKELTVSGASDTNSEESKKAISDEITEIKKGIVDIMNTTYAGRYIFAGYDTGTKPYAYAKVTLSSGEEVEVLQYKGKYLSTFGPVSDDTDMNDYYAKTNGNRYIASTEAISYRVSEGSEIKVNDEGQNVVGWSGDAAGTEGYTSGQNLFETIDKILLGLSGETSYKTMEKDSTGTLAVKTNAYSSSSALVSSCLDELEQNLDRLTTAQSSLGARMNYVSSTGTRLDNADITYTKLQSKNEDIDVAEASMEVQNAKSVYEASLSVTSKVTSASLVDYLR